MFADDFEGKEDKGHYESEKELNNQGDGKEEFKSKWT